MTTIASAASLLHTALQDLHAGKRDFSDRLPALCDSMADEALRDLARELAAATREQADRIARITETAGPRNLWMAGILDDAERDARTTQPGRLLDTALIGAIRKAQAATIVSSETAIALAAALGNEDAVAAAEANRREEIDGDQRLRACLRRIAG